MAAMALAALLFGGALGLRYNAWALLLCLGTTVLVMSSVMLVSASPYFIDRRCPRSRCYRDADRFFGRQLRS